MILDTSFLAAYALLFLRIIVAIVFLSSGKSHFQNPVERGKSIGMSPEATRVLGIAEIVGAISITLGVYSQIGALLIMGAMAGAMYKKIAVWNTGFYAKEGFGWHYDLLLFCCALVIFATDGGYLTIT